MSRPSASVLLVTGGALLGQMAVFLATPVLTRLYSPMDMGRYAVFVSIVGVFATIVSLHYELAIALPRSEAGARRVSAVALIATVAVTAIVAIALLIGGGQLVDLIGDPAISDYLWLIPICLFTTGISTILTFWAIRQRSFTTTAASKVLQGVGQAVPQVAAGLAGAGIGGLLLGQVVAPAAATVAFLRPSDLGKFRGAGQTSWRRLRATARRYRRFPLITTWSSLINALGAHLPVIALVPLFGAATTGQFALAYRVLQIPLRLIGQAVSQVFLGGVAGDRRTTDLSGMTWQLFRSLVAFGLPSFVIIGLVAPELFEIVFGTEWRDAGVFSQLLIPWMFTSFIATVLSILVSILEKQAEEFGYQVAYIILTVTALGAGMQMQSSVIAIALLGVLGGALMAVKIGWLLRLVGISLRQSLTFVAGEAVRLVPGVVVLGLAQWWLESRSLVVIGAIGLVLTIHLWNFRVRQLYRMPSGRRT